MLLLGASVVELIAATVTCGHQKTCGGVNAYAVWTGGVSVVVCLLLARYPNTSKATWMGWFLLLWWAAGWFTFTFIAPFDGLADGFIACWVALLSAVTLYRTLDDGFKQRLTEARDANELRRSRRPPPPLQRAQRHLIARHCSPHCARVGCTGPCRFSASRRLACGSKRRWRSATFLTTAIVG